MIELHPYGDFVPKRPRSMIIGSFPIGKFTNPKRKHEIRPHEYDFFFGGEKNLLWKLLGQVFNVEIKTSKDIVKMLEREGIGIGDVIRSCRRKNGGASDSALYDIKWNTDLLELIKKNKIKRLYFTGKTVERWFDRLFPETDDLEKIGLISPSAQSVRALTRRSDFKKWEKKHPGEKKFNFILEDYRNKFETNG